jgi:predicted small lipoprotein YifL
MPRRALLLAIALLATASLGLSACGRKGRLEPPPEQKLLQPEHKGSEDPGYIKPKKAFPLDPLLN